MSLEEILKPVKYVDEQILRQYTKLAQKAEKKGIEKYFLSSSLNFVAKGFFLPAYVISGLHEDTPRAIIGFVCSLENTYEGFHYNSIAREAEKMKLYSRVKDIFVEKMRSIYANIRLPVLISAGSQIGLALTNFYNYVLEKDNSALHNTPQQLLLGTALLLWSSAMYVRDSDPKLLDKQPFYKAAYEWAKEKLTPTPQPVPTYSRLEDKISN